MATTFFPHISFPLVMILVHTSRAQGDISYILFDIGRGPASKGREVIEIRIVVIVRVPQWIAGEFRGTTSDGIPLTSGGVNTDRYTLTNTFIHHILNEVDIVAGRRGPVLSTFDINPQHAISGA